MSDKLPTGGNETSINDLLKESSLYSDGDWVENKDQDEEGANRLIQLADIGDGIFQNKSNKFMNDEQFRKLRCTELKEGDILIARMPDPLGRACFFPKLNQRCATVVDVAILRNPNADAYWLMSMINSSQFRRKIENQATGTTRTRITRGFLAKLKFPAPSISSQQKISVILKVLDQTIEKTEALIHKYQQLKAGLMHDLFTRGLTADGKLRPPREQAPELYQKTPIGWIPKEWDCDQIANLLAPVANNMRSGPFGSALLKAELVEEGVPFLGIDNIHVENFVPIFRRFVSKRKFRELSKYAVKPRDVVITIMGTVGRCALIPNYIDNALSSKHLWAMTFDQEKVVPELICWQLNYADWVKSWFRRETQGGIMDAIQSKTLKTLRLPIPPPQEQERIFERYNAIKTTIEFERDNLEKLQKQKSGLMHDLLTGKVPVTIEPAAPAHV